MSFAYSDFPTSDSASHLIGNFFRTNFVSLFLESYILRCLLRDKAEILEFFYKTNSTAHSLDNTHKCDYTEIAKLIFWLDITKLLFYFSITIVVFMTRFSYLWVS